MGCGSSKSMDVTKEDMAKADRYTELKTLGSGASCRVVQAEDKESGTFYAMKVMDKEDTYNEKLYKNEVKILDIVRHDNILRMHDHFEDPRSFKILTEYCQGGELFDKVSAYAEKNLSFTEKEAAKLTREMLLGLAYCHSKNIVHRDLKPENFVFKTQAEDSPLTLIDFGVAVEVADDGIVKDVCGSPYYVAPEVLKDEFKRTGLVWKGSDMWSVGVICFLFVCGYPPFNGHDQARIFGKIRRGKFRFPSKEDNIVLSDGVKDFISKLLVKDPMKRFTAEEALKHPWVMGNTASDVAIGAHVLANLADFRNQCKLKKAVGRVLAQRMTEGDKGKLMEVFKKFDTNGDGRLGPDEIANMMQQLGQNVGEMQDIIQDLDVDGDGALNLDEMNAAQQMTNLTENKEEEVKASFDVFDTNGDGFVSQAEIEKLCNFLDADKALHLIGEVDENGDGKINFDEWVQAMKGMDLSKMGEAQGKMKSAETT